MPVWCIISFGEVMCRSVEPFFSLRSKSARGKDTQVLNGPPGEYGRKAETKPFLSKRKAFREKKLSLNFYEKRKGRAAHLKELVGEHFKGCGLRFNWIQRRTSHQRRQQFDGHSEGVT